MLREREDKLLALEAEYERVSELSKLTQAQADAVAKSLELADQTVTNLIDQQSQVLS